MNFCFRSLVAVFGSTAICLTLMAEDAVPTNAGGPKSMAEASIALPEYFGLYAVQRNGKLILLDKPARGLEDAAALSLEGDVEFLLYGKDVNPSDLQLFCNPVVEPGSQRVIQGGRAFSWEDWLQLTTVEAPANFAALISGIPRGATGVTLFAKPISNQPLMFRMIPGSALKRGVYQLGTPEKVWYRFAVGPIPPQRPRPPDSDPPVPTDGTGDDDSSVTDGNRSQFIDRVCPGAVIGEFTHGTRCTGYYGADGKMVDIQLTGVPSTKPFAASKELVHAGVDLSAPEGTPVFSMRDGVVVDVIADRLEKDWKSLGYMVMVAHTRADTGDTWYSVYLHLKQKPLVAPGDSVVAGKTELGLIGSTGSAYGNHVHIEVRWFKDRFNRAWNNIYGKLTPESEKTFDEVSFKALWRDPVAFASP